MDEASGAWPRRLARARAVVSAVAILAAGTLAGCDSPAGPEAPGAAVAHPAVPDLWPRPARPSPAAPRAALPRTTTTTWQLDPDVPLPGDSPWRSVLAVARRFAAGDLSYEVGRVGPAVRWTLTQTCTRVFAAELLAHRATLPPGVRARAVRQKLATVAALERLAGEAVVLVTVRSSGRPGRGTTTTPGAFELRLVPRPGGWRVAGLSVV